MTAPTYTEITNLAVKFDQVYAEINDVTTRMENWIATLSGGDPEEFRALIDKPEVVEELPDGDKKRFATFLIKFCR